ncbi:MAG TPA: tetratricopeptide repeat protein, partial [bacterium]|nr:tetratricopeptide repeat protein [bacterium]
MKTAVRVLLLLLLPAINYPASGEEAQIKDAPTLLGEAKNLISEEKHHEAAGQLESILKQFPDTPQAKDSILLLADSYAKLDLPEKAEETYLSALEKYQNDAVYINRIHNVLANFYLSQKQYEKSIEQLQLILQTKPNYKTVLSLYGKIVSGYIALDQPDKAADTLQTLLKEYPGLVDKYSTDTSVLQYHRLRTQVDKDSFTAETTKRIASFYEKSNQPDLVNAAYALLTKKFPESPYSIKGFRWLADNLSTHNKYAEAIPFYL